MAVKQLKPTLTRSSKWPTVRKRWLRLHPECAGCGNTKNHQVHHMKPVHLFPELELDDTNFITLCEATERQCHYTFGHFYDWWKYNPDVVQDTTIYLHKLGVAPGGKQQPIPQPVND